MTVLSLSLHCYPAYDLGCPVFKRTLLPTLQSVPAGLLLVQQCSALTSAISSPQTVQYSPSRTGLPSQKGPQGFNTIQNSKPTVCMDKVRPLLKYRACRKSDQVPLRPIDCGCSVLDVCCIKSGWCGCTICGWWKKNSRYQGKPNPQTNHQPPGVWTLLWIEFVALWTPGPLLDGCVPAARRDIPLDWRWIWGIYRKAMESLCSLRPTMVLPRFSGKIHKETPFSWGETMVHHGFLLGFPEIWDKSTPPGGWCRGSPPKPPGSKLHKSQSQQSATLYLALSLSMFRSDPVRSGPVLSYL